MTLDIQYQESFSRGKLLLRTFFGWLYIAIPHLFLLTFIGIWAGILQFLAFWAVLFTGSYPENWVKFLEKYNRWSLRVNAALMNLTDENPSFGLDGESESVTFELPYPSEVGRVDAIVRTIFGVIYVGIPHGFCLGFRALWGAILMGLAWWVVLFTGKYPAGWHAYNVGTIRWSARVNLYIGLLEKDYPAFSGKA